MLSKNRPGLRPHQLPGQQNSQIFIKRIKKSIILNSDRCHGEIFLDQKGNIWSEEWTLTRNEESIAHKETAHVKLRGGRVVHSRNQDLLVRTIMTQVTENSAETHLNNKKFIVRSSRGGSFNVIKNSVSVPLSVLPIFSTWTPVPMITRWLQTLQALYPSYNDGSRDG